MAQAVSEFQALLGSLADQLQSRIAALLGSLSQLGQSDLLAAITDLAPELLAPFITAAADLTAAWYEAQDPASDYTATPTALPAADDLAATARWAVLQPDPVAALSGAASNAMFEASRQTVIDNATTEGVKWMRYAREDACGFCKMLAVKGFFYNSETTAKAVGHKDAAGHAKCNCTVYPDRGDAALKPENLMKYEVLVKDWEKQYQAARKAVGKDAGSIANAMDYMPGGRRYKGDDAPPHEPKPRPVDLDAPKPSPKPAPPADTTAADAQVAKRLLPGLEKSLADLRARGLPEDSPQIQYHLTTIERLRRQLARR